MFLPTSVGCLYSLICGYNTPFSASVNLNPSSSSFLEGHLSLSGDNMKKLQPLLFISRSLIQLYLLLWPGLCPCKVHTCVCAKLLQCYLTCYDAMDCNPPGSSVHEIPHKNTGMGCHALFQGIFSIQVMNLCLLCHFHWHMGSLPLAPCVKGLIPG